MKEQIPTQLTPAQAADVIHYYDLAENADFYTYNRRQRKIALGLVALHTTSRNHSILSDKTPLLTHEEMTAGLDYLGKPSQKEVTESDTPWGWPVEPTEEQWEEIFATSDKRAIPIDEAYAQVMGIGPTHWK